MMRLAHIAQRAAYGALFAVGVPLLLVVWAHRSAPMVRLRAVGTPAVGGMLAAIGAGLLAAGIVALIRRGRGLPMNAFPPTRLVSDGVYAWLRNPIYIGFGLVVLGASLATRSASGLWLVTPVTWLAMASLVFGYERHDLRRRFGDAALAPTRLALPRADDAPVRASDSVAVLVWVFGAWLFTWVALQLLGPAPDAFSTLLPGESELPVVRWMEWPYVSAYIFVPLTAFVAGSRRTLREFALSGLVATVVVTLCWLVIPEIALHRPFDASGWSGTVLQAQQTHSTNVGAFPAFHVLWPMLAARAWGAGRSVRFRAFAWGWALAIVASSFATGHHSAIDVAAGVLLYFPLRDVRRTWSVVARATERVANSWHEWRTGPLRIINHGAYAGAGAAVGLLIAGSAVGAGHALAVVWVGVWVLVGAGAYAQVLEGSSKLLRPFGWYGGLLGGVLGVLTSPMIGGEIIPLMAAFALAAPWIQILGRFRCLVQGCCHGGPAPEGWGIHYYHPRSRVAHLAHLTGVALYPTPLYSIAGNVVIGVLLLRLRMLGAPPSLSIGVYFMLSGCARFVEEAFRGEPQTPVVAGLRIYQWFAVATMLAGVAFTMMPTPPGSAGLVRPSPMLLAAAACMFIVFSAAMGLDFPRSNRRFSRLASAD